ncbi:hypothetical protein LPJ66_011604, partial [Kickxella alabastrina]
HPGHGAPMPPPPQQQHPQHPQQHPQHPQQHPQHPHHQPQQQLAHQPKAPQHHHQGPAPAGRPEYPEDAGYGRYESMPRPEHPSGAETPAQAQESHYPNQAPPGGGSSYPGSAPYPGAPYPPTSMAQQALPATRPYSTPGHPQSSTPYAQQPQQKPPSTGPYRNEDVHMASRNQSPMQPLQQPQQPPHRHQQQQSTPAVDQTPASISGSAFQQGPPPVNGYTAYSGPPSAVVDAHNSSRSPTRLQSPGFRQQQQHQPQSQTPMPTNSHVQPPPSLPHQQSYLSDTARRKIKDDRQGEYLADDSSPSNNIAQRLPYSRNGSAKIGNSVTPSSGKQSTSVRAETRVSFSGDRDSDVAMVDAQYASYKTAAPTAISATGAPILASTMTAAAINLPQITTPIPASDFVTSSSSTPALSGPTAAPIRLPPVQLSGGGGSGGFNGSGTSVPSLGSSNGAPAMVLAADEAAAKSSSSSSAMSLVSSGETLSLASALAVADEDKEDSAINSLMSLSNVATTLTSRPQMSLLSPQPGLMSEKFGAEAVVTS